MPICYCGTGGYGRFLQVVEQKPVQQKVEERQETELAKPSKRETRVRCVETGREFETVKQAGCSLAALGLGKDAAVAATAVSKSMRTGGTSYGFHFVKVAS